MTSASKPYKFQAFVTVMITGEDPAAYFSAGDHFALWMGHDIADGVVTRRVVA
jgi:hypothetical protein